MLFALLSIASEEYVEVDGAQRMILNHVTDLNDATKFTSRDLFNFNNARQAALGRYAGDLADTHKIVPVVAEPQAVPAVDWYELEAPNDE